MSAATIARSGVARHMLAYYQHRDKQGRLVWSPEEVLQAGLEFGDRMSERHTGDTGVPGCAEAYATIAAELRQSLARMLARRAPADVVDELLSARVCVHGERADLRTRDDRSLCAICRHAEAADDVDEPVPSRFAPPLGASPVLGGRIPDVEPVAWWCSYEDYEGPHAWDGGTYCLVCEVDRPPLPAPFSQAGLASLVGAR